MRRPGVSIGTLSVMTHDYFKFHVISYYLNMVKLATNSWRLYQNFKIEWDCYFLR